MGKSIHQIWVKYNAISTLNPVCNEMKFLIVKWIKKNENVTCCQLELVRGTINRQEKFLQYAILSLADMQAKCFYQKFAEKFLSKNKTKRVIILNLTG